MIRAKIQCTPHVFNGTEIQLNSTQIKYQLNIKYDYKDYNFHEKQDEETPRTLPAGAIGGRFTEIKS